MSTGKINARIDRFAELAKLGEVVFHAKDLANLWQIENSNTLYTTIKRYVKRGLLFRIYKGFYSLKPVKEINSLFLGIKALHEFSYVSTETVLSRQGIISQVSDQITLISSKSKRFSIGDLHYLSRKLADRHLFNSAGIIAENGARTATSERAAADLLYFNPRFHFDGASLLDWRKVKNLQKEIGYSSTPQYYDFTQSKRRPA